jgi:hypothetical protein
MVITRKASDVDRMRERDEYPTAEIKSEMIKIGFGPHLSINVPIPGATTREINAP